jgi:hypothetical protein
VLQGFPLFPRRSLGIPAQRGFQRSLHPILDILLILSKFLSFVSVCVCG